MAPHGTGAWNIALMGASTLQGKEVKAVFEERKHPSRRLRLVDAEDVRGLLTQFDGEPAVVQPVNQETFEETDLAIFSSSPAFTELHWRQAQASGCRVVDLSHALDSESPDSASEVRLAAPLIDPLWETGPSGNGRQANFGAVVVSAHPMSIALAGVLKLVSRRAKVSRAVATLFAPASDRGQPGVEELHQQTINLLSFQEIQKKVFDAQLSFNLLTKLGDHSHPSLRQSQERIANHLRVLLRDCAPLPALRLLQAPVFHGYSFSLWVELATPVPTEELNAALNHEPFSICGAPEEPPSVLSAASSDSILLGPVENRAQNAAEFAAGNASEAADYWIWGAFDNLRVAALNAMRITDQMMSLASGAVLSPSGRSGDAPPFRS